MVTCEGLKAALAIAQTGGFVLTGVLSALVAALAWLTKQGVSGAAWHYRRRQREREIVLALRAEIMSNLEFEQVYADPDTIGRMVATMERHKVWSSSFIPYVTIDPRDLVMDKVSNELTVLPAILLPAIVRYYNISGSLAVQLGDLRSESFRVIGIDRQIHAFKLIGKVADDSCQAGNAALRLIDGYLVKPSPKAILTFTFAICVFIIFLHSGLDVVYYAKSEIKQAVILASSCDSFLTFSKSVK